MNWIILALAVSGIIGFIWIKWYLRKVNAREEKKHNENPVYVAANFRYEYIRLPWIFHALLALSCYKLIEQVAFLTGVCH